MTFFGGTRWGRALRFLRVVTYWTIITPSVSQNTVAITFSADRTVLIFFPLTASLIQAQKKEPYVLSLVTIFFGNSFPSKWKRCKYLKAIVFLVSILWSVNKRGSHRAHFFLYLTSFTHLLSHCDHHEWCHRLVDCFVGSLRHHITFYQPRVFAFQHCYSDEPII